MLRAKLEAEGGTAMPTKPAKREPGEPIPAPRPWPGDNSQLPNNAPTESEALPDDIERDISQEGVSTNPKSKPVSG